MRTPPRLIVRGRQVDLARPLIMGTVAADPRDGPPAADVALAMVEEGAGAIAVVVGASEATHSSPEANTRLQGNASGLRRLVEALRAGAPDVLLSVEVDGPADGAAALEAGADIVRDVGDLLHPETVGLCAETGVGLVVRPEELSRVEALGLSGEATLVDPGLGSAETFDRVVAILRELDRVGSPDRPILLDLAFGEALGPITGTSPRERLAGTLAAVGHAVRASRPCVVRAPDVETAAAVADYLAVAAVLSGRDSIPEDLMLAPHLRRQPPV